MKRLIPTIIAIILLAGCASFDAYCERDWHEKNKKWVVEQNKKCPIKDGCFATTSMEYTPTMLTYNIEALDTDECKKIIEELKRASDAEWEKVVRRKLGNKVALMYVSLQYRFFDEQGNLINEFVVYGGD